MIDEGNARTQRIIEATERLIAEIHQRTLERMEKRAEERHKELLMRYRGLSFCFTIFTHPMRHEGGI